MKKIIKVLLLVAIMCAFLTGCGMLAKVSVTVNPDRSVKMAVTSGMDDELIEFSMSQGLEGETERVFTEEEKWAFLEEDQQAEEDENVVRERYDDGTYKGFTNTRTFNSIDEISAEGDALEIDYEALQEAEKVFVKNGDNYTLHINLNESGELADAKSYSEQGVNMLVDFEVTLPTPATSNNASIVSEDGLTYTWHLLEAKSIDISFNLPGGNGIINNVSENNTATESTNSNEVTASNASAEESSNNLPLIIGIVCAVAVVAVIAVVALKKKNNG